MEENVNNVSAIERYNASKYKVLVLVFLYEILQQCLKFCSSRFPSLKL